MSDGGCVLKIGAMENAQYVFLRCHTHCASRAWPIGRIFELPRGPECVAKAAPWAVTALRSQT